MNGIKRRGRLGCNEKESKSGGTMRYEKIIAEHVKCVANWTAPLNNLGASGVERRSGPYFSLQHFYPIDAAEALRREARAFSPVPLPRNGKLYFYYAQPVFKPLCVAVPEISCENAINTKVNAWSKKKVLQASQNGWRRQRGRR